MFQSNKLIQRFHHLYLIQAFVEIQRHCNNLYSKFKHRVLYVVGKRLHLSRLKLLKGSAQKQAPYYDDYFYHKHEANGKSGNSAGSIASNIIEDLNHWLMNPSQGNYVSVPMQMLLLPFIVQPHGLVANGGNVSQSDTCHMYRKGNIIINNNNNNNNNRIECQQWRGSREGNVCAPSDYVTFVPGQMLSAQSQTIAINEHSTFTPSEQRNQIKFSPASRAAQDSQQNSYCRSSSATWSKAAQAAYCDSYSSTATTRGLSMRNPLMNYPSNSRRQL